MFFATILTLVTLQQTPEPMPEPPDLSPWHLELDTEPGMAMVMAFADLDKFPREQLMTRRLRFVSLYVVCQGHSRPTVRVDVNPPDLPPLDEDGDSEVGRTWLDLDGARIPLHRWPDSADDRERFGERALLVVRNSFGIFDVINHLVDSSSPVRFSLVERDGETTTYEFPVENADLAVMKARVHCEVSTFHRPFRRFGGRAR